MKYISKLSKAEIEEFIFDAKGRMVKSSFVCPGCGNQMSEGWCFQNKDQYIMLCKPCKKLVSDEIRALKRERRKAQAKAEAEAALLAQEHEATVVNDIAEKKDTSHIEEPNPIPSNQSISMTPNFFPNDGAKDQQTTKEESKEESISPKEETIALKESKTDIPEIKESDTADAGVSITPEVSGASKENFEDNTSKKEAAPIKPTKKKGTKTQLNTTQKRRISEAQLSSTSEPVPFSIIFLEEDEENFKEYLKSHSSVEESTYPNIIRYLRRLKEFQWISYDRTMNFPTLHPENVSIYVDNLKHISGGEDLSEVWLLSYFRLYLYFKRNEERMKNRPKKAKTTVSSSEKKDTPKVVKSSSLKDEASPTVGNNPVISEEQVDKEVATNNKLPVLQSWNIKRANFKNTIIDSTIRALDKLKELLLRWRN